MKQLTICLALFAMLAVHVMPAMARVGPWMYSTHITIINATPYVWRRGLLEQTLVRRWDAWPETIGPGAAYELRFSVNSHKMSDLSKATAKVQYQLIGTLRPMGLEVGNGPDVGWQPYVKFLGDLETLNNARETRHNIGLIQWPGGVGFMLAGMKGHFISNDGPLGWMQALLPEIGNLTLRELTLPKSHQAGMWYGSRAFHLAKKENTLMHEDDLYQQLGNGGMRVLDLRIIKQKDKKFWHAQWSEVNLLVTQAHVAMAGASLDEMIGMINRFTRDVPGELIILDLQPDVMLAYKKWRALEGQELAELYDVLRKLHGRFDVAKARKAHDLESDVSTWPLRHFIGDGKTAVLVRLPGSWAKLAHDSLNEFPSLREGFVTDIDFPVGKHWSNTNQVKRMVRQQLAKLQEHRPNRQSLMWDSSWQLTQSPWQAMMSSPSIVQLAGPAWRTLCNEFWANLTEDTYPNWISMDRSHGNQLKTMAMAINYCPGARKCGDLGGKVKTVAAE